MNRGTDYIGKLASSGLGPMPLVWSRVLEDAISRSILKSYDPELASARRDDSEGFKAVDIIRGESATFCLGQIVQPS